MGPTGTVVTADRLMSLLRETQILLVDFDGPVCSVFAGLPAARIARQLRGLLWRHGVALPDPVMEKDDPHEILRYTGSLRRAELTRIVDDALTAAEVEAARVARPTPYAREVVVAARETGRPVAIVSTTPPRPFGRTSTPTGSAGTCTQWSVAPTPTPAG